MKKSNQGKSLCFVVLAQLKTNFSLFLCVCIVGCFRVFPVDGINVRHDRDSPKLNPHILWNYS